MTGPADEARALRPLWSFSLGAVLGALASLSASPTSARTGLMLVAVGIALGLAALAGRRRAPRLAVAAWFAAGLAVAGGRGLPAAAARHTLDGFIDQQPPLWIRARMSATEGWTPGRWGRHTRARLLEAAHDGRPIPIASPVRVEIRGRTRPLELPPPGRAFRSLVSIRGSPEQPLLVISSQRLIEPSHEVDRLAVLRDRLVGHLFDAAGTDVRRIRAAELCAALTVGRRDVLPRSRREGWRRSGLAHVLAVSGLHVGLVGGMLWLGLALAGASPTVTRVAILVVLPSYAVLAGAPPSAVRAAMMASVYLVARLMGRAILPMAAVLVTASALLVADPALITRVSFQLTVLITAALVRWAPPAVAALPMPRWLAAAVAIPCIAQLAAAPIIAHHFRSAIPGAAAANLLVPLLLGPVVLGAVAATLLSPWLPAAAAWMLDLVDLGSRGMWWVSAPGRAAELVPPALPSVVLVALAVLGVAALLPGRRARIGFAAYTTVVALAATWCVAVPPSHGTEIELLPVASGLALRVGDGDTQLLMDGGASRREAAELLADSRVRRLDAVIVTHDDEDHIGGLATVLRTVGADNLVLPVWLLHRSEVVPLLRLARRRAVRLVPVARGSRIVIGSVELEILWPPARSLPAGDNERSLAARLGIAGHAALLTADIGRTVERTLAERSDLACSILVVPHHGSRGSVSPELLDGAAPTFALIPAGPENRHHHPHPEVLARLEQRGIDVRMPIRDGRCGARLEDAEWVLYP